MLLWAALFLAATTVAYILVGVGLVKLLCVLLKRPPS